MSDKAAELDGISSNRSIRILSRFAFMPARIGGFSVTIECCRNGSRSPSTMMCGETRSEFGAFWIADEIRVRSNFS